MRDASEICFASEIRTLGASEISPPEGGAKLRLISSRDSEIFDYKTYHKLRRRRRLRLFMQSYANIFYWAQTVSPHHPLRRELLPGEAWGKADTLREIFFLRRNVKFSLRKSEIYALRE